MAFNETILTILKLYETFSSNFQTLCRAPLYLACFQNLYYNNMLSVIYEKNSFESEINTFGMKVLSRCFKITEKVSFNIASEASYVYILSGQKLFKNAKNGPWEGFQISPVLTGFDRFLPGFCRFLPVFFAGFGQKFVSWVLKTLKEVSQCWLLWQKVACCMEIVFNMKFFWTQWNS